MLIYRSHISNPKCLVLKFLWLLSKVHKLPGDQYSYDIIKVHKSIEICFNGEQEITPPPPKKSLMSDPFNSEF